MPEGVLGHFSWALAPWAGIVPPVQSPRRRSPHVSASEQMRQLADLLVPRDHHADHAHSGPTPGIVKSHLSPQVIV